MLPIKKILCPVDFSDFSCEALSDAGELAAHFGAELYVLHVTQSLENLSMLSPYPGSLPWDMEGYEKAVRDGAEEELGKIIARQHLQGIAVRPLLRHGYPTDEIVEAARASKADLLVIATHGLGGWRHLMFGSVAEKVIRLSCCPVLVTHSQKPPEKPSVPATM